MSFVLERASHCDDRVRLPWSAQCRSCWSMHHIALIGWAGPGCPPTRTAVPPSCSCGQVWRQSRRRVVPWSDRHAARITTDDAALTLRGVSIGGATLL